jgi:transposase
VDRLVICNPRRNHLIAKESDKDDPIDALKLAELFRGGYLKEVYHPECFERAVFKQHVGVYHERVKQRVREANRILAQFRRHGVFLHETDFVDSQERPALLKQLPHPLIQSDVELLWKSYDAVATQVEQLRKSVVRLARKEEVIRRFTEVPGVAWLRAATFYAYLDTPWRFKSKTRLWRYLGIGLDRRHSGNGPMFVFVYQLCSRVLRNMILGAAKSAVVHGNNPYADQYVHWTKEEGISPRNARRNVARSLAMTLWGMWKNGSAYRPERVGCPTAVRVPRIE